MRKPFGVFENDSLGWRWLVFELAAFIFGGVAFLTFNLAIEPRDPPIQPDDLYRYAYPHKEDQILDDWLVILIIAVSVFLIVPFCGLLKFVKRWDWRAVADDVLVFVIAYLQGLCLTMTTTELLKRTVCRPRPDYLNRCLGNDLYYQPNYLKSFIQSHDYGTVIQCVAEVTDTKLLKDGRMSFPSGHSSGTTFAYMFLCLWAYQRLQSYRRAGFLKLMVPGVCFLFPLFVMVSRVMDNRHNPLDVISGGLIGATIGVVTYKFYYPFHHCPLVMPRGQRHRDTHNDTQNDSPPVDSTVIGVRYKSHPSDTPVFVSTTA